MQLESLLQLTGSVYLNAVLILLAFLFLGKLVDVFFRRILRGMAARTKTELDEKVIDTLHKPVYKTIVIIGGLLATSYVAPTPKVNFVVSGVLESAILLIWGSVVFRLSHNLIEEIGKRISDVTGLGRELLPLFENIAKVLIIVVAGMIFLSIWRVDITPLVATAGIAGFAVAFAAKDTIANFFGGISVFVDRPYKIGDYIILDSGERGEVVDIGVRSTRIKTRDDILISIPNSIIANTKIINESAPIPRFRLRVPVGVAYGSDVDKVEKLLLEIARSEENVVDKPAPRVRFRNFGDSALNFELLCWVSDPRLKGRVTHSINSKIYKRFADEGIVIPYPQRDVHLYKE
jgi:small-conductance mechanosensitive channel